jgi:hypothetical protein
MSLNEYQERRLGAALRTIEDRLAHIDALLAGDNQAVTSTMRRELQDDQGRRLRELRAAMLGELADLAERFAVRREQRDEVRSIDAALSAIWVTLEELRGDGLSGSGDVDPADRAALAPYLERMLLLVEQMHGILSR